MTITYFNGAMGTVSFNSLTTCAEFSVKIDRAVASHARSGEWSDYQVPGKVSVTGTLKRIMIEDGYLDMVYGTLGVPPATFNVTGTLTSTDAVPGTVVIALTHCFLTSAEFKFTDANEIVSDNVTFTVTDPDADVTISTT